MKLVQIYGSASCTYCVKAKNLLSERTIPFKYYDLDEDFDAFDELVARITKWETVPQIFVDGEHIGGCDELEKLLLAA